MIDVTHLAAELLAKAADQRFILGIAGPPGSGKSTLAQSLFQAVESIRPGLAVIVPMDGFHLDDQTLADLNLLPLKGIPATFDAQGFVTLLETIQYADRMAGAAPISAPLFDRSTESSIQNAIPIFPTHSLILVEGNYLLLEDEPWNNVRTACDEVWYLDVPETVLFTRLIERHMAGGKDRAGAKAKVDSTDLPNARLVAATGHLADKVLTQS